MKSNKEARTPNYTIGCIETLYACGKYSQN